MLPSEDLELERYATAMVDSFFFFITTVLNVEKAAAKYLLAQIRLSQKVFLKYFFYYSEVRLLYLLHFAVS